jgi:hypothetical protein
MCSDQESKKEKVRGIGEECLELNRAGLEDTVETDLAEIERYDLLKRSEFTSAWSLGVTSGCMCARWKRPQRCGKSDVVEKAVVEVSEVCE